MSTADNDTRRDTLHFRLPTLYVGSGAVHALPMTTGLRSLLQRGETLAGASSEHPFNIDDLPGLEAALAQAIGAIQALGRARRLQVVLSDAHCRYLSTRRPSGLRRAAELSHFLLGRFNAVYGPLPDDWQVAQHAEPGADVDLAVGARSTVLASLARVAASQDVTLVSIQPEWVCWHTLWHKQLRRGHHWLVSGEGGWATVGYLVDGRCVSCRSVRPQSGQDWSSLLSRHRVLVPEASPDAMVWLGSAIAGHVLHASVAQARNERLRLGLSPWSLA